MDFWAKLGAELLKGAVTLKLSNWFRATGYALFGIVWFKVGEWYFKPPQAYGLEVLGWCFFTGSAAFVLIDVYKAARGS